MSKGILFIDDSIFINEKKLSMSTLINDKGQRTLYALHKLLKKDNENIAYLWQQLQDIEKQFFHLSKSTIKSPVSDAISQFYNEARENRHIDNAILERIFVGNTDVEIIDILDTIKDEYIQCIYYRTVYKKRLYEEFCFECYSLFDRIANAIDSSKKQNNNNKFDDYNNIFDFESGQLQKGSAKEKLLLSCYSRAFSLKSLVRVANRYDIAICILSEDYSYMIQVFASLYPEIDNVILVPNKQLHNYRKSNTHLYNDICSQLDDYDYFCLIDDNEVNINAAKSAGWSTILFDYNKNCNDFNDKKLEQNLLQEVKKLIIEKNTHMKKKF